ncbi:hypothetical protein LTSEALA_1084 [Salmonella enterica subsp. enterica serovar Alachua str. R6-377]|uniref:Uncharacterized protein n=1 Tax=Salmonella enterica subsp. enterica serovar Alachua str. R6-377 TaxID=913241 RepID=G5LKX4_SALET|nr:hypothetical protein LTSEALA_1084 [Salmonella enterica subsp. enterica serovar Alachua str. R6-377]
MTNVLIVEDEQAIRRFLRAALEGQAAKDARRDAGRRRPARV